MKIERIQIDVNITLNQALPTEKILSVSREIAPVELNQIIFEDVLKETISAQIIKLFKDNIGQYGFEH